jgi:CTP:molybdopterin cytidylyltransferase MocA
LKHAGLVLAAGAGTRFGPEPKLLAELRGRPLLQYAVSAPCAVAELERVVVVLGARADEIAAAIDFGRAEPVVCEQWREGLSASLRCGVKALAGYGRVIVTLGDEPLIGPELIARFVGVEPGTRATYGGRPGHPVVLGPEHMQAIGSLWGDHGARDLLAGGPTVACDDLDAGWDVDTVSDLAALRRRPSARGGRS